MKPLATLPARARPKRPAEASGEMPLRPGTVDVWRASLDAQSPEAVRHAQALVSPDEDERARRFYFERDRRRFVVGRGILRTLLGAYLGRAPRELEFRYGANGKPALANRGMDAPLFFNVSHSEGLAAYAVTQTGEVGIDVERVREIPEWEQIASTYFLPRELARLAACPAAERSREFFRAWARQEARLKAQGVGLGGPASAAAGAARRPDQRRNGEPPAAATFQVHAFEPAPGYVGALAVTGEAEWLTSLDWPGLATPAELSKALNRASRVRLEPNFHSSPDSL